MLGLGHLALRESFNVRLTLTVLLIAFSQLNFGLDQQGFSATQAMDSFEQQFGVHDTKKGWYLPTVWLSYFNGFHYLGQAAGVVIGSYVSNYWGRRMCMFTMSIWAIVAATIVITAKSSNQILAGRCLNYIYIGMELAVVPIYQSEVTPRRARGFVVGTYQLSLYLGGLIINCIARGTSTIQTNAAWRIIYGMFYVVPTIVAALVWFVPESPRWLALQDRHEEALASLKLLREGKFTDEQIEAELRTILNALKNEPEQGKFVEIFQGTALRRTIIVVGINIFLQASGQIFTTNYGAIFVKSLGTVNPFTITAIIAVVNCLTAFGAMVLVDRMGRRFMILFGATIQMLGLYTMGGLGTAHNPSHGIKSGIISMMVISSFGYSFGWAPMAHTLSAEIPSAKLRDMTYRSASVLNIATQFAVSFSLPYLLNAPYANLKSRVGFIFGTICFISLFFTYFLVPDCAGKSLEEVDYLFEQKTSARKFRQTKVDLQREALDDVDIKTQNEQFDKA